jgi:23S rRNA (cytidine1920-2'-O)/16S rRNA (cytidine1409-2'-O)-methyltransferase
LERLNARGLQAGDLPYAPEVITIDVSFISLDKVLPAVLGCAAPRFDCLALVKPQFEVGRERIGKGGVVRDAGHRREALIAAGETGASLGASVLGYASSGLPGPKGNLETFIWLAERSRPGIRDLATAAAEVEP